MKPVRNKEELVKILSELWDRIFATKEIVDAVSGVKIVTRFRYTDIDAAIYIDTTGDTPKYYWDPEDKVAFDVEMILSTETSHKFWMEELNVPLALAGRKIVAKGSVQKALKLIPALKPAFALYPQVLRDLGREDLLEKKPAKARKKRKPSLFKRKKKKTYSTDVLPRFPMELTKGTTVAEKKKGKPVQEASEADLLKTMCTIRAFEMHLSDAFREGNLPTEAIHLSIGQEGVAAGVCMNMRDTDYLNTTHRGHGHIIARGADLKKMMAEIYGRSDGLCEGKGGSMHVTDGAKGILGANGIVGAGYLLAMGAGLTIKREKRDDVSAVIAGDGSVNQGMFHEAMNMISVFELPVLIVVENNRYGEFTSIERHSAVTEIWKRAEAYNIEAQRIDGNDVKQVYHEIGKIIEKIRSDGKPRFVELMTYRWHGHMEGDPEFYRSDEEKETFKKEDPIQRLRQEISAGSTGGESEVEKIQSEAEAEVLTAVEFALGSEPPEPATLLTNVYTPEDEALFSGEFRKMDDKGARDVSIAQAINEAIAEEMERDEKVFLWGEDVTLGGYFNVTEGLVDKFGSERIIDTPISEYGIIGGAVGAAMTGMRPISEILFSDFLTCCMDPILNQAAKLRYMTGGQVSVPLTIRTPLGSGAGLAAQHSQSMEKFFFGIPGLMVVAPSDAYGAKGLLKSAIRSNNPVLFFEHKLMYGNAGKIPDGEYTLPLGKARVVLEGKDVTIVSHSLGVSISLDAAQLLASAGISAEVIDLTTLYPLDTDTILESVKKTGHLVAIEEGTPTGGISSEVIARTMLAGFGLLNAPPLQIAAPESPIPYARNLENAMLPNPEHVAEKIEKMF